MRGKDTVRRNEFYHCLEYDYDQKGELFLVACGVEKCDPGVTYGPERRICWHLHVVRSGCGTLWAGGSEFQIRAGQMFLLKDGEEVRYSADALDPWEYCWVTYNGSAAQLLTNQLGFTEGVYCLDVKDEPEEFYELIRRMHQKPEMNYVNDVRRKGILLEFLALAMESTASPERKMGHGEHSPEYYVGKAIDFIHYNYATINVGDIINYVGFSRSYFSSLFRKQTGVSLQDYLNRFRMERASSLLGMTDLPVQDIARQVGFEDPLHFSRAFRKQMGQSPTEYRAQNNG